MVSAEALLLIILQLLVKGLYALIGEQKRFLSLEGVVSRAYCPSDT